MHIHCIQHLLTITTILLLKPQFQENKQTERIRINIALWAPTSKVFFNCNVFSSTQSQALLPTKGTVNHTYCHRTKSGFFQAYHTLTHHYQGWITHSLIMEKVGYHKNSSSPWEGARDTITCDFSIFLERWTWVVYSDTNRRATWFQSFLREWIQQQTLTYPYNQKLRMDDRSGISPTFFLGKSARTQSCQSFIVFLSNRCLRWKATKPCPSSSAQ